MTDRVLLYVGFIPSGQAQGSRHLTNVCRIEYFTVNEVRIETAEPQSQLLEQAA